MLADLGTSPEPIAKKAAKRSLSQWHAKRETT
jgi:hypothetical protein